MDFVSENIQRTNFQHMLMETNSSRGMRALLETLVQESLRQWLKFWSRQVNYQGQM